MSEKQILNDLNWVVESSVLLNHSPPEVGIALCFNMIPEGDETNYQNWFKELVKDPSNLIHFFNDQEQLILGKYFERLLFFFFQYYPRFEIVESGKQLFIEGETIGEIDFIVRDLLLQKNIHYEVAVKYYLGFRNSRKHDMWIGPNGLDTLAKKMRKFSKQLSFSRSYKELINEVEIDYNEALIKGYLFQHINATNWPHYINDKVGKGKWMYENEMELYLNEELEYLIVPKVSWLSFYVGSIATKLDKASAIKNSQKQISEIKKGIMLVSMHKGQDSIIEKMMILPLHWPHL